MKKSEHLFHLVKSLTPAEMRYFRRSGVHSGESNYLLLFDAIVEQKVYDEAAIRKQFAGARFLNELHVAKNYLRNRILEVLRSFHSRISKDAQVKNLIRNVEILYHRELYALCSDELKRAERIAIKYELDNALIEIFEWKRKVLLVQKPSDIQGAKSITEQGSQYSLRLFDTLQQWQNLISISEQDIYAGGRGPQDLELKDPEEDASLQAKVLHYLSKYHLEIQRDEVERGEETMRGLLALLESHAHMIQEDPRLYVSTVNNYLSYLVFTKRYEDALGWIERAKATYAKWDMEERNRIALKNVLRTYNIELEIYRDSEDIEPWLVSVQLIEDFIVSVEEKVPSEYLTLFWFQLASIRFKGRDFSASLKWINKILSGSDASRRDLVEYAHWLNLIIHFELNNLFFLGYSIEATRRYIRRHSEYGSWKKHMLKQFGRLRRTPEFDQKQLFQSIYESIREPNHAIPKGVMDYVDFEGWILTRK